MSMFSVLLPDELHKALKNVAAEKGVSVSRLVKEYILKGLLADGRVEEEEKGSITRKIEQGVGRPREDLFLKRTPIPGVDEE